MESYYRLPSVLVGIVLLSASVSPHKIGEPPINIAAKAKLQQVLHNVFKVVEAFLYFGEGEGSCIMECPPGLTLRPREHVIFIPSQCAALEIQMLLPDMPSLEKCCDAYDLCYATCGKTQRECDEPLRWCLQEACLTSLKNATARGEPPAFMTNGCTFLSQVVYTSAGLFGCEAYRGAQNGACVCMDEQHNEL